VCDLNQAPQADKIRSRGVVSSQVAVLGDLNLDLSSPPAEMQCKTSAIRDFTQPRVHQAKALGELSQ
jgi:hypothetical protein